MRPECKELVESWHRINAAAMQRRPLSMEYAIQTHIQMFPEADRKEAEKRVQEIVAQYQADRQELELRLNTAEKTLSKPINSVGTLVTVGSIRVRRAAA